MGFEGVIRGFRGASALLAIACAALLAAPVAQGNTADILEPQHSPPTAQDGFQAGPCSEDEVHPCTPTTFERFFKTAGGHPPRGFIQFIVRHEVKPNHSNGRPVEPLVEPIRGRLPRTVKVDLPPGLSVNPEASAVKCSLSDFQVSPDPLEDWQPDCPAASKIGEVDVNLVTGIDRMIADLPKGFRLTFENLPNFTEVDLFNLVPRPGEPALFGFLVAGVLRVFLEPEIAWDGDFHESFTIRGLPDFETLRFAPELDPLPIGIHSVRLSVWGRAGDGTLTTLPTTCFDPEESPFGHIYSSWMRMDSHEQPDQIFPAGSAVFEAALPPSTRPEGCESIPFDPSIEFFPRTFRVDSPSSPEVTAKLKVETPGRGGGPVAQSHLRTAEVVLPPGMGLNPAGASRLVACSDAFFHKGDRTPQNECPARSAIGTVEIASPALTERLMGKVYLGEPRSSDPASGEQFRIFVEGAAPERGVVLRLIGKVKADPGTGQLTARFDEQEVSPLFGALPHGLPQLPLEFITLRFDESLPLFTTPPTCAMSTTTATMEPWARPGTHLSPISSFTLATVPGGGVCPTTLAERAFQPPYRARTDSAQAAAHTPLRLSIGRPEGQQELKQVRLALPKGMIAKLAGIPKCSEGALAAAQAKGAAAEQRSPSCAAASLVGSATVEAGTGPSPLRLSGNVYLAGPYRGAPLSLAAVTPALAGPFDLGNVVTRVALHLDPATTQITAVSDLLPDVFGGVKLDLRTIDLDLSRQGFILNPTSCSPQAFTGTISGGGADPADPAAFSAIRLNAPFQASGCDGLGFKPKLVTKVSGPTKRGKFPRLTVTLQPRPGDANLAGLALTLPRAFFVAQQHIASVCTRSQLAARACPSASVYGQAEASSPLLDGKLSGPVYLVPGGGSLPDLVFDLHGEVDVQLRGTISAKGGRISTTVGSIPDVPLREFALRMAGGKKGLLVNSANICKAKRIAPLSIDAQNGKQVRDNKYKLNLASCKKKRGKKK